MSTIPKRSRFQLFRRFLLICLLAWVAILVLAGYGQRKVFQSLAIADAQRNAEQIAGALQRLAMERFLKRGPLGARGLYLPQQEAERLDKQLKDFLGAFQVVEFSVSSPEGIVVYHTDTARIGTEAFSPGPDGMGDAQTTVSWLEAHSSNTGSGSGEESSKQLVRSQVPVTSNDLELLGRFSIATDVSGNLATADRYILSAMGVLSLVTLIVFATLGWLMYMSERRLRTARRQAETANEAKSQFLANMSHELRSPLHGVLGMASLLRSTELGAEQKEYVDALESSSRSLLSVINDILDFSKIEAKKLELENQPFEIRRCVEELADVYGVPAGNKGLDLVLAIDPGTPSRMRGDVTRIKQILANLIDNAIKFTESGEIHLRVDTNFLEKTVQFTVRDTGMGLSEDALEKLFLPFEQADASTTRRYGGSGLGLSISSQLAEKMGGSLSAGNHPSGGAQFTLALPISIATKTAPGCPSLRDPVWANGETILIAEGREHRRKALGRMLESWGFRCLSAADAIDATAHLRASRSIGVPVKAVLVAVDLEGLDPEASLARTLREKGSSSIRCIGIAPVGWREDYVEPSGKSLYDQILRRPIKPTQLEEILQETVVQGFSRQPAKDQRECVQTQVNGTTLRADRGSILVVEDNAINRRVAVGLLEGLGYDARAVTGGEEALLELAGRKYDLILMDVQMPELDGIETTRRIRHLERPGQRRTPIVAMTAHALKGDRERFLEAGMDAYIAKPARREELEIVIGPLLGESPVENPLENGSPSLETIADLAYLRELAKGDREILSHLVWDTLKDAHRLVGEMNAAYLEGDRQAFLTSAHDLKTTMGYFSTSQAVLMVRELEAMGKRRELTAAGPALEKLNETVARIDEEIHGELGPR